MLRPREGPGKRGTNLGNDRSGPDSFRVFGGHHRRPRQDSNLRSRLRRAVLYPLSYGGSGGTTLQADGAAGETGGDLRARAHPARRYPCRVTPEQLSDLIVASLADLSAGGVITLPTGVPETVTVERPRQKGHGDYATNVALQLAKQAGMPPREFAT